MAFPATQLPLSSALELASSTAARLKEQVQFLRDASAAGTTLRGSYLTLQQRLSSGIDTFAAVAATPGIEQYARDQYANQGLNIGLEFTTMRNAAIALRDWIHNNFPRDAVSGAVLLQTYSQTGQPAELSFTSVQMAPFRTQADLFLATVS